ncbi:MAG: phosphoenolpyruvate carboxykinase [Bradyrhizobium sp.]|nr:MAG: phosphoenolpyruvate carboxykinase [Bradyrhizobium sp.]
MGNAPLSHGFERLFNLNRVRANLGAPQLYEESIRRGEGVLSASGALVVQTGEHTGRSPNDKFIVRDALTESTVWWETNKAMTAEHFDTLLVDFSAHAAARELYVQELFAAADPTERLNVRVFSEFAWHSLFIRNLLIRPDVHEVAGFAPGLTIIDLPSFRGDPARHGCRSETVIACDFTRGIVLIGGTNYAGEIKKSVFTYLNFTLPARGVMPMHCSANAAGAEDVAVFFGLSGTGKTTLSTDPDRTLIGDDEHGWGPNGVFNFEGGCYAKAIKLSRANEPEIFAAANRFGAAMENVTVDPVSRAPDFDDGSKTENTRVAYPIDFIANASITGRAGAPRNVVMLTCDAFGVLPPIAKLTPEQASYHFLSGYTAKVAGTERGVSEPKATFSACFGAPFMSRHPAVYGELLTKLIAEHRADCWLINTGWSGGGYGVGRRMPIDVTRRLLAAALSGSLEAASFRVDPVFGFRVPEAVSGIDAKLLDPVKTWSDARAYVRASTQLADMFEENFRKLSVGAAHPGARQEHRMRL